MEAVGSGFESGVMQLQVMLQALVVIEAVPASVSVSASASAAVLGSVLGVGSPGLVLRLAISQWMAHCPQHGAAGPWSRLSGEEVFGLSVVVAAP